MTQGTAEAPEHVAYDPTEEAGSQPNAAQGASANQGTTQSLTFPGHSVWGVGVPCAFYSSSHFTPQVPYAVLTLVL